MKQIDMTKRTILTLAVFALSKYVNAYKNGAPQQACQTMTPNHGAVAQTMGNLYIINVEPATYQPGSVVTVTLNSTSQTTFKGFLIEVKTTDNKIARGFSEGDNGKLLNCESQNDAAITHEDNDDKTMVKFKWTAPADTTGDLKVCATVVQSKLKFWTMIKADLKAENGASVIVFSFLEMFAAVVLLRIIL